MYRVANASEYLGITGVGFKDIKLAKKAWIFPGQSCTVFDLSPANYTFEVQAMSAEKLPFVLPVVFTIGPKVDDHESLLKYATLLPAHDQLSNHVKEPTEDADGSCDQARVDVAEAKMKGEIGAKMREGQTLQNAAKIDPETKVISMQRRREVEREEIRMRTKVKVFENEREAEVAEANTELAKKKAS